MCCPPLASHPWADPRTRSRTQHAGNTQNAQIAVDKETEIKRAEIVDQYRKSKDAVVKKLLDRVTLVTPELHRNLTKRE